MTDIIKEDFSADLSSDSWYGATESLQMPLRIDLVDPWIFVDDDDPGIIYDDAGNGVWIAERGLSTDLHILNATGAIRTPVYGTLHSTGTQSEPYVFNYKFNGMWELF